MFNGIKGLKLNKKNELIVQSKHQANGALIGMMLGDSSMTSYVLKSNPHLSVRKRTRVQFSTTHAEKYLEYLLWKESILRAYVKFGVLIVDKYHEKEGFIYYRKTSLVKSSKNLVYLYERFYKKGRKTLDIKLLHRLTDLGLAIFFMDDGSLTPHSYKKDGSIRALKLRLHTCNFNYAEHLVLKKYFSELGVDFNITKDKKYFCLSTGKKESIINFFTKIIPFVMMIDCMFYKIKPYFDFISANYPVYKGNDIVYST